MPYRIVAHPETGIPVKEEILYTDIEREQLEAAVTVAEGQLTGAEAEVKAAEDVLEEKRKTLAGLEGQLKDAKSGLEVFDEIAQDGQHDAGSNPASGGNAPEAERIPIVKPEAPVAPDDDEDDLDDDF